MYPILWLAVTVPPVHQWPLAATFKPYRAYPKPPCFYQLSGTDIAGCLTVTQAKTLCLTNTEPTTP
ncbi:MAG: hypothetical protein KC474_06530 [Cyanobacteria bacterium HKST-UBA04]|nr:hypothetical protein [Cyanobacteria bacterium HKST-UBA04]MCA9840798.1 hypothetical protein [Cyanobacteria bacterium HKST-UBA03]